ncbi:hypothetical protein Q0Z83_023100 [Actinoplanes sichuanensis]|uniref:Uncharacterized protein n=1 Tax=Actinoplanes sichuanensis TaxID=512349 RepID=A0ABW4A172_9ACTN|nr:hypothetical protein [Actinoplanes sichuanensis]BEL04119.1 hypothetical protein Q0Z83_023100 [Actinoplanes sichuanensis]
MTDMTLPPDGRYEGSGAGLFLELRNEATAAGVVSGDLFLTTGGGQVFLASFRTSPDAAAPGRVGPWRMRCQDSEGRVSGGVLELQAMPDGRPSVRLRLDRQLNALPAVDPIDIRVTGTGPALRILGVEVEREVGVIIPDGARETLQACLAGAGVEIRYRDGGALIPRRVEGWEWHEGNIYGALDETMARFANPDLAGSGWRAQLLMLSHPFAERNGLYGVMFDVVDRPRQGCAVFVDEIREHFSDGREDHDIAWTMAHEVGHVLNLTHRFELEVGRADSTSVMNYADQYRGGGRQAEYWQRFAFRFDPDEVSFLRHGTRRAVMPGASPFHTVDYWSTAPGAKPAHVPPEPDRGLVLRLVPPRGGTLFAFGQPVVLQVLLSNAGSQPVALPRNLLDVKAGFLQIMMERDPGARPAGLADARAFAPLMQRCFTDVTPGPQLLAPGASLSRNVNLTFGAEGHPLDEPGSYRLTPLLTVPDNAGRGFATVIRGEPLLIHIGAPASRVDERDAVALLQPGVGAFLAVGGTNRYAAVPGRLRDIADQRRSRNGAGDPIAAALHRTLGIYYSRAHLEFGRAGCVVGGTDQDEARALLDGLTGNDAAMLTFDPQTAKDIEDLAATLRRQSGQGPSPPSMRTSPER